MTLIALGSVVVFMLAATTILLSRLTTERLSALGKLRELVANNATYATTAIAIGTEFWNAYSYHTSVNWVLVLSLLGITTTAAKVGRAQEDLKTNTEATKNTADSVDLVLNTMPVGPKNPVPGTRTQVTPGVTPPLPVNPNVVPRKDDFS